LRRNTWAKKANENTNAPSEDDVQQAVANIEQNYTDLLREKGIYMNKCRGIRQRMSGDYDTASEKGISKKILKKIIKSRDLERKVAAITHDLEPDELSEHQMFVEKLGEFANTPLGKAALASVFGVKAPRLEAYFSQVPLRQLIRLGGGPVPSQFKLPSRFSA